MQQALESPDRYVYMRLGIRSGFEVKRKIWTKKEGACRFLPFFIIIITLRGN